MRSCSANSRRFSSASEGRFGLAARSFSLAARRSAANVCAFFSHSGCTGLPRLGPCSRLTHTLPSIGSPYIAHGRAPAAAAPASLFRAVFAARVSTEPSAGAHYNNFLTGAPC